MKDTGGESRPILRPPDSKAIRTGKVTLYQHVVHEELVSEETLNCLASTAWVACDATVGKNLIDVKPVMIELTEARQIRA